MLQVVLSGLASGAIYGLVGMGFAIAFYVTRVINFAEGQLLMVGVMVAAAISRAGAGWVLTVAGGIAAAALMGAVTYLVAVRPVLAFDRSSFAWLVDARCRPDPPEPRGDHLGADLAAVPAVPERHAVHIGGATLTLQEVVRSSSPSSSRSRSRSSAGRHCSARPGWPSPTTPRWRRRSVRTPG